MFLATLRIRSHILGSRSGPFLIGSGSGPIIIGSGSVLEEPDPDPGTKKMDPDSGDPKKRIRIQTPVLNSCFDFVRHFIVAMYNYYTI